MVKKTDIISSSTFNSGQSWHNLGSVLNELVDYMDIAVWQLDRSYRITSCNHKAFKTYGNDIIGKKCHMLVADNPTVCPGCPVQDRYRNVEPGRAVQSHRDIAGNRIFVEQFAIPIADEEGVFSGALVLLVDITRHKRVERELKQQALLLEKKAREKAAELAKIESKFALAFDASPDAININRLKDGLYVDVNKGFIETTGYAAEEVIGKNSLEIDIWENPADRRKLVKALEVDGFCQNLEAKFRKKDGSLATALMSARVIDLNGEPHIISITRDISAQQKNEAERDKLIAAVQQTEEAVVITDQHGIIEFVNSAFERITGYHKDEVLGENPRILQSGEHDKRFYKELWQTISSGSTFKGRMVNKRKDGSLYTEEATISPVVATDGRIVNYVGVKRDISSQLTLERQLHQSQKMESIGRLTGGVAHDFNNLLSVIQGHSELAMTKLAETAEVYEDLEAILDAAQRSAMIIRQLLAFSRQQTIAPQQLELNSTVEKMLNMLGRLIGEEINLQWIPYIDNLPVKIDPSQLDQILANLCVNAKDAIESHGKITIETGRAILDKEYCNEHAGFQPGDYAVLSVSDEGHGIHKKDLAHVFEPFFTTKELGRGTGLGLSTVYGIVKQNDGFINVYSEVEQGTTVKIYLPYHQVQEGKHEDRRQETFSTETGSETILLVEDDEAIRTMVAKMLTSLGYFVLLADSPVRALELVRNEQVPLHLLLTDVVMPEMNGEELVGKLRRDYPELKCLYMSGYTVNVIANKGVLKENVHFLQKPFSKSLLARKIREALQSPSS